MPEPRLDAEDEPSRPGGSCPKGVHHAAIGIARVVGEDTTYTVAPVSVKVHAGIITGEFTDMQVVERVERRAGRVTVPTRLLGTLRLRSISATHCVRLVAAKISYLDDQWRPMKLDDSRTAATCAFGTYGSEWLDPGQEAFQAVDVAFPAEALKARKLKGLRLEIGYASSPYREEVVDFAVSVGGP